MAVSTLLQNLTFTKGPHYVIHPTVVISQHSCIIQLISLIENLSHALDQQKQTDVTLSRHLIVFHTKHYWLQLHLSMDQYLAYQKIRRSQWVNGWWVDALLFLTWFLFIMVFLKGRSLAPWCFLLYIYDITEHVNLPLWLFSDDCLLAIQNCHQ